METKKPLPTPDEDTRVFWEGCNNEKLMIQRCTSCEKYIFYPRFVCPHCMSDSLKWEEVSGEGKVYTYTISRRPAHPSFKAEVPYIVAMIELNEGVRMLSNVINCDVNEVRCDMRVKVVFEEVDGVKLPKFEPI